MYPDGSASESSSLQQLSHRKPFSGAAMLSNWRVFVMPLPASDGRKRRDQVKNRAQGRELIRSGCRVRQGMFSPQIPVDLRTEIFPNVRSHIHANCIPGFDSTDRAYLRPLTATFREQTPVMKSRLVPVQDNGIARSIVSSTGLLSPEIVSS